MKKKQARCEINDKKQARCENNEKKQAKCEACTKTSHLAFIHRLIDRSLLGTKQ
jgi:hypothetical protein